MRSSFALQFVADNARLLTFGFAAAVVSGFGQTHFLSVFLGVVRTDLGMSNAEASNIYALATVISAVGLAFTGHWIDRWPLQRYCVLACVLMALGAVLFGYANGVWMFMAATVVLRFSGQGMSMQMSVTPMARYFVNGRGVAVSIAASGLSVGMAVFPVLGVLMMQTMGWRSSWHWYVAFVLLMVLPLLLWLLKGQTQRHAAYLEELGGLDAASDAQKPATAPETAEQGAGKTAPAKGGGHVSVSTVWKLVLRDFRFYQVLPSQIAMPLVFSGITFHQVHIVAEKQWTLSVFAAGYMLMAGVSMLASMLCGWLVDRWGTSRGLILLSNGVSMVAILALWLIDRQAGIWIYMLLGGVAMGAAMTQIGTIWPEMYGRRHIGVIRGMMQPVIVLSSALAPMAFGYMLDANSGHLAAIMLASLGYYLLATALVLPAVFRGFGAPPAQLS